MERTLGYWERYQVAFAIALAALLAVCALSFSALRAGAQPQSVHTSVVGGIPAAQASWQSVASIYLGSGPARDRAFTCGGTLVDREWVLTAGHCVTNAAGDRVDTSSLRVVVGRQKRSSRSGDERSVERIVLHPGFRDGRLANDLALLKLSTPSRQAPMPLLEQRDDRLAGSWEGAILLGWGYEAADGKGGEPTDELMQGDVTILAGKLCRRQNGASFRPGQMICAQGRRADHCFGDSGGPLIVGDETLGYSVAGVVTWAFGESCFDRDHPGNYARVSAFADWIKSYTAQSQSLRRPNSRTAFT